MPKLIAVDRIQIAAKMFPAIHNFLGHLEQKFDSIPGKRKEQLITVSDFIGQKITDSGKVDLIFICTHNSRRSHLAQIWTTIAAAYYDIEGIKTYSGGTETTAFNINAIHALEAAGLEIDGLEALNPVYQVSYSNDRSPLQCFSKKFDHPDNPTSGFVAVMTCSDADENCPVVPGAEARFSITYSDPKESDGTGAEAEIYADRSAQIALEMLFLMSWVKKVIL